MGNSINNFVVSIQDSTSKHIKVACAKMEIRRQITIEIHYVDVHKLDPTIKNNNF